MAAGALGVACDAGCRAVDVNGVATDDVFVAGDVSRFPHRLYDYQFLALEHWGNATAQAQVAAHNMVSLQTERWPYLHSPAFWSAQFGTNIKSVGVSTFADQVVIAQGSVAELRFVADYGYQGRITAAVAFNHGRWLEFYQRRRTPVARQADGSYVVGTYDEIVALLHDPRVSSDPRSHPELAGGLPVPEEGLPGLPLPFIQLEPPDHDRVRELATRSFGPPCTRDRIDGMRPWLAEVATGLIGDFAYPLPVTAICRLQGVPVRTSRASATGPTRLPRPLIRPRARSPSASAGGPR
ncbi:oxidoreductase C-terminal domain-containing protein [Saccharopolyspora hattusasensis]|uniref:oxidoreductase C-terminal domain-containing protein n=1 Tax=Saccharopolyspora hattusasensis TaxID=1128679 RepID=UPI003D95A7E2